VFEDRVAVGHARNVVGHGARPAGRATLRLADAGDVAMLLGHQAYVPVERAEELRQHPAGLRGHAQHPVVAVDALTQESLELLMGLEYRGAERDERLRPRSHLRDRGGPRLSNPCRRGVDDVDDDVVDHAADGLVDELALRKPGMLTPCSGVVAVEQADLAQVGYVDEARAQSIVHVVIVVRDLVGEIGELGLEARLPAADETLAELAELPRVAQRAVLQDAFAALEREVEPVEVGVAVLELIDDPQRLQVVLEAAVRAHALIEGVLAGVSEGSVPEIVRKTDGLGERLVEIERTGDRTGDLRDLERVGDARAVKVTLVVHEHLRFVDQAPEGIGVDDAVAIALILAAEVGLRLRMTAPAGLLLARGVGSESLARRVRTAHSTIRIRAPGLPEMGPNCRTQGLIRIFAGHVGSADAAQ